MSGASPYLGCCSLPVCGRWGAPCSFPPSAPSPGALMTFNKTCALGRALEQGVMLERGALVSGSLQLVLAAAVSVLLGWRWLQHRAGRRRSPPGPFPWPLIGNAAQVGRAPHLSFSRMAERYGSVFSLKLGSRTVVVLNGEEAIRQALVRKGGDFAGRPDFASFGVVSDGRSLAFRSHGDLWRLHRKVAHSTVRAFSTSNPGTKKAFEQHVQCEMWQLIGLFLKRSRAGAYFDPGMNVVVAVANVMSAVCFGKRYSHDDQEFRALLSKNDRFGQTVGAGSLVDIMPWLQHFPNPIRSIYRDFKQLNRDFYLFIQQKVHRHRQLFRPGRVRDMMDAFILAIDHQEVTGDTGLKLSPDYVESTVGDIFGASQDTLSTALHWVTLYLVSWPEVQRKVQQEVDRVVGRQCIPTIEDQPRMPYLMAFLHEALRFSSFVSLTIPHATTRDTLLNGYHIDKGTVIFVNQWSVNHDARKWRRPELFDPERFLSEDGSFNKDLGSRVMIFSVGRRRCIGDELAKMQLFLSVSLLMHQCTFTANPSERLSLDFTYGLSLKPKTFTINVTLRDSMEPLQAAVQRIQEAEATQ
ncbi:cytochrome P450 1B1-like [Scyliorhinus canicula]|uniref:cytochrome P450 1B1-like n=1 Tax=Scyliorhinus canicula TaxID=7830 RepID=UPI0018F59CAB|nr:cytochrome P450 1B1-like [Scyliorhinus canicula]